MKETEIEAVSILWDVGAAKQNTGNDMKNGLTDNQQAKLNLVLMECEERTSRTATLQRNRS